MSFEIFVSEQGRDFISILPLKSQQIVRKNLGKLKSPYPGRGIGDKERLLVAGEILYRLHIGRTFTAFYIIEEESKVVRVIEILTIEAAHKKYGS